MWDGHSCPSLLTLVLILLGWPGTRDYVRRTLLSVAFDFDLVLDLDSIIFFHNSTLFIDHRQILAFSLQWAS
jgi:hypothetical protein